MQCRQKQTPQTSPNVSKPDDGVQLQNKEIGKTVLAPYFGECIEPARTKTCCWQKPNLTFVRYREYCTCK